MKDFSKDEWGLVLAGGGGKGAYQIGVFRALREKGVDNYITAVSGSSVGALNAILYDTANQTLAENVWMDITYDKFLKIEPSMIDFKEGIVSREGLTTIFEQYIDMELISHSDIDIYITTTKYDQYGMGDGIPVYHKLNYLDGDTIEKLLLASSAMPIIYEPINIDGYVHRDGGVSDNLPIEPLYEKGMRHFIVVGLSDKTQIDYDSFPGAEFVFIKPGHSIGDFFDGTLDFSAKGARIRMEIGYMDAIRVLEFSDKNMDDADNQMLYRIMETNDYEKINFTERWDNLEKQINSNLDKINDIFNRYS